MLAGCCFQTGRIFGVLRSSIIRLSRWQTLDAWIDSERFLAGLVSEDVQYSDGLVRFKDLQSWLHYAKVWPHTSPVSLPWPACIVLLLQHS